MTKSDGPKYEPPCGVRLGDAANARGSCIDGDAAGSCGQGNSDVSCRPGNTATAHCDNGMGATGCLTGTSPQTSTCNPGSTPMGGCVTGDGVHPL